MAVAEELATEVRTEGGVLSSKAVTDVLVGAHGAGAVLDDVQGFGVLQGQGALIALLQGERREGVVRALRRLACGVLGVLREEESDVGALPNGREDLFDGVAALHEGVVEMLARNSEEVERARRLAGFLAAPRAVRPSNEVRMLGLAADFVGEFLRDADFIRGPVVNGALLTEGLAE